VTGWANLYMLKERLARPLSPPIPNAGILRGRLSKLTTRKHQEPWQWQRDFLPVDIEVATGAVVLGNDATPIVTVAEFKKSRGSLETTEVSLVSFFLMARQFPSDIWLPEPKQARSIQKCRILQFYRSQSSGQDESRLYRRPTRSRKACLRRAHQE